MELHKQPPKLSAITLRSILMRLHWDLFTVHDHVDQFAAYYPDALTNLEKLVLALEDRRFMHHAGFDFQSVIREVTRALMFRRHGGASTIDMQFVRTATGYRKRSLSRKIYEVMLAVIIQYRYSKITILRSYLAHAFFGSHLIGARKASLAVFGLMPDDLDLDQASWIAAMLVYPKPKSGGVEWLSKVRRRAAYGKAIYISNKEAFDKLPGRKVSYVLS